MSNVFKLQRQSFGDKKVALKSFVNFTREHLQWSLIFIFLKIGLHGECFPVSFAKFFRATILENTCGELLLVETK